MPFHEPEVAEIMCARMAAELADVLAHYSLTPMQKAAVLGGVGGITVRDAAATEEQAGAAVAGMVNTFHFTFRLPRCPN